MSYSVFLYTNDMCEKHCVSTSKIAYGGTYQLGGTTECDLNITYNYSTHYYKEFPNDEGLFWLQGKYAKDTINMLEKILNNLGHRRNSDYWKSTKGNAGYSIRILLGWARENPEGIWMVI
tara:strand:+ start:814 stop:1173 length:360 start_codon:yes stop_codon:yes gene_type:complete